MRKHPVILASETTLRLHMSPCAWRNQRKQQTTALLIPWNGCYFRPLSFCVGFTQQGLNLIHYIWETCVLN